MSPEPSHCSWPHEWVHRIPDRTNLGRLRPTGRSRASLYKAYDVVGGNRRRVDLPGCFGVDFPDFTVEDELLACFFVFTA